MTSFCVIAYDRFSLLHMCTFNSPRSPRYLLCYLQSIYHTSSIFLTVIRNSNTGLLHSLPVRPYGIFVQILKHAFNTSYKMTVSWGLWSNRDGGQGVLEFLLFCSCSLVMLTIIDLICPGGNCRQRAANCHFSLIVNFLSLFSEK